MFSKGLSRIIAGFACSGLVMFGSMAMASHKQLPAPPTVFSHKLTTVAFRDLSTQFKQNKVNTLDTFGQHAIFDQEQRHAIEDVLKNYLLNHPEILIDALRVLHKREMVKSQEKTVKMITQYAEQVFNDPNSPVFGNPHGDINVVEFLDHQCAHCKTIAPILETIVSQRPHVRFVIKVLPILGNRSLVAAKAVLAAQHQGRGLAFKFHNALLKASKPLTNKLILRIAKHCGLDVQRMKLDMKHKFVLKQLDDNFKLTEKLHIRGTPAIIVAGNKNTSISFVPGAVDLKRMNQLLDHLHPTTSVPMMHHHPSPLKKSAPAA